MDSRNVPSSSMVGSYLAISRITSEGLLDDAPIGQWLKQWRDCSVLRPIYLYCTSNSAMLHFNFKFDVSNQEIFGETSGPWRVPGASRRTRAIEVLRGLQRAGCDVRVAMTRHACEFIQPLTFRALTGSYVAGR